MNIKELEKFFEKFTEDEFLLFEKVENKRSRFPEIHAILLLEERFPPNKKDEFNPNAISCIQFPEIALTFIPHNKMKLTENDIIELIRCGISYNKNINQFEISI